MFVCNDYEKLGIYIAFVDHVVVMRKGDYPVSITSATQDTKKSGNSYPENLDDIILPLDGKM